MLKAANPHRITPALAQRGEASGAFGASCGLNDSDTAGRFSPVQRLGNEQIRMGKEEATGAKLQDTDVVAHGVSLPVKSWT